MDLEGPGSEVSQIGSVWSRAEVESIVPAYFEMLKLELSGKSFVKKSFINDQMKFSGRSRGSVEFKFQNISAVLSNLNLPFVYGYKPSKNYQSLLGVVVGEYVKENFELFSVACQRNFNAEKLMLSAAPASNVYGDINKPISAMKIDWVARERSCVELGKAGERLIFEYEKRRLQSVGCEDSISRLVWVSQDIGDGLGYDIKSVGDDGEDVYIEVKATVGGVGTPFFITPNEVAVSDTVGDSYRLYRLYDFAREPRFYVLKGSLGSSCLMRPAAYLAIPANNAGVEVSI